MILEYAAAVCTATAAITTRALKLVLSGSAHARRAPKQVRGERLAPTDDQQARRVSREPGGHLRRADAQGPHLPSREERHTQVAFLSLALTFILAVDCWADPLLPLTIITITGTSRPPTF